MLAKRIITCLDVKEGRVVKGINFLDLRDAGDPVELAALYDKEGSDELVFLDITASYEKRNIMEEVVRRTAEQVFIPFTVGGGIRTVDDFRRMLKAGADKCSINTSAVQNPELISEAADKFGSQCVVVAIDPKRVGKKPDGTDQWDVHIHGGRTPTGLEPVEWAVKVEKLGAGEIMLTSMDADGTLAGYDIPITRAVAEAVSIPVIASGGAGTPEHIREGLVEGKADAALISSIVHFRMHSIRDIKEYLRHHSVPVRL